MPVNPAYKVTLLLVHERWTLIHRNFTCIDLH